MMATETGATWMRLRDGSWGLRGPASMTEGSLVTVTRRDGSSSQERVARVLWRGESEAYASVVQRGERRAPVRQRGAWSEGTYVGGRGCDGHATAGRYGGRCKCGCDDPACAGDC